MFATDDWFAVAENLLKVKLLFSTILVLSLFIFNLGRRARMERGCVY